MCTVLTKKQFFLLRDIKQKLNKWKDAPYSWKEKLYIIKMSLFHKLTCNLAKVQSKAHWSFGVFHGIFSLTDGPQVKVHRALASGDHLSPSLPSPQDGRVWASVPIYSNEVKRRGVSHQAYDWDAFQHPLCSVFLKEKQWRKLVLAVSIAQEPKPLPPWALAR